MPTSVAINDISELRDGRRDLQSLHQNSLLSLQDDILRPSHETSQISLRQDGSADSEVLRRVLEERIKLLLWLCCFSASLLSAFALRRMNKELVVIVTILKRYFLDILNL